MIREPTTPVKIGFDEAFVDAEGCRQWLKTVPLTNLVAAAGKVAGQLERLRDAPLRALERVRVAEVLRDPVMFLHAELAKRYAGKPVPHAEREREAADRAIAMWSGLWGQYSLALKALIDGDDEIRASAARLLQRALFAGKQQILAHGLARRHLAPSFWRELHAFYRFSEILGCQQAAVADKFVPGDEPVSCYSTYTHALLLALADPYALSVREIDLTDRWLAMWARKVNPSPATPIDRDAGREGTGDARREAPADVSRGLRDDAPDQASPADAAGARTLPGARPEPVPMLAVDLDAAGGFAVIAAMPTAAPASWRYGQTAKLAQSVRGRVKKLIEGAMPASLKLGDDCSTEVCLPLLKHLFSRWCLVQKRLYADAVETSVELCAGGLPAMYFRASGRTVPAAQPRDRLTFSAAQRLRVTDALPGYDPGRDDAERDWPWEDWQGVVTVTDARLARVGVARHRWQLDQVVACREGDETRFGFVSWIADDADDAAVTATEESQRASPAVAVSLSGHPAAAWRSSAGVTFWPGPAEAALMHSTEELLKREPPFPALILGNGGDGGGTLVLPPRAFAPGRRLQATDGDSRTFRLLKLLQRGTDFERVSFALD